MFPRYKNVQENQEEFCITLNYLPAPSLSQRKLARASTTSHPSPSSNCFLRYKHHPSLTKTKKNKLGGHEMHHRVKSNKCFNEEEIHCFKYETEQIISPNHSIKVSVLLSITWEMEMSFPIVRLIGSHYYPMHEWFLDSRGIVKSLRILCIIKFQRPMLQGIGSWATKGGRRSESQGGLVTRGGIHMINTRRNVSYLQRIRECIGEAMRTFSREELVIF